ncbi:MAG: Uncharacterised protein [Cryomorphaceae bacterium]|nr:MAG: Uncharacterised protein [Cryomorphaceae bacterium]
MKGPSHIQRALRLLFLSKALYYSILWIVLSLVVAAIYTGYNFIFLPNLSVFRTIGVIFLVSATISFVAFPLRLLLSAACVPLFSNRYAGKLLRKYDGGRTSQYAELATGKELERWSASKVLLEFQTQLPQFLPAIKQDWNLRRIGIFSACILLILLVTPSRIWKESSVEIFTGQLRPSEAQLFDIPDTLRFNFGDKFDLSNYKSNSYTSNWTTDVWEVTEDTSVEWSMQGRYLKRTAVLCDSIPNLNGWSAKISPPAYLGLNSYIAEDTLRGYLGSKVTLDIQGILLDNATLIVSRGTFDAREAFELQDTSVQVAAYGHLFNIPVRVLTDANPRITVLKNSRDSLQLALTDDFGLNNGELRGETITCSGTEVLLSIKWSSFDEVEVMVVDTKGQRSKKTVSRPQRTSASILSEAAVQADPLKTFVPERKEKKEEERESAEQRIVERKKQIEELLEKKLLPEAEQEEQEKDPRPEDLEELLEKLDELWKTQQLIEVLEQIDTTANAALDSAVQELSKELDQSDDEKVKETVNELKELPTSGDQRQEQAKESVKKLQEALAEAEASVAEENVERIKRLLKSSWMTSTMQEQVRQGSEVSAIKTQRNLMLLEQRVLDSLSMLIISDAALAQALRVTQAEFSSNLSALRAEFIKNGLASTSVGYVLTSLNEIDKVLYFILESEKQSLAAAKKKCKSGTPGDKGMPSKSGSGSKGKKGKKPGEGKTGTSGRKPGKTGGKRPAKSGQQGEESGEGGKGQRIKEGLKRIDEALQKAGGPGGNKALERKLEQLKQELLFDSQHENFNIDDVERRLWEATKSTFEKEEKGDERKSTSGDEAKGSSGKEVRFKIEKNTESALPLPVLKKQKK